MGADSTVWAVQLAAGCYEGSLRPRLENNAGYPHLPRPPLALQTALPQPPARYNWGKNRSTSTQSQLRFTQIILAGGSHRPGLGQGWTDCNGTARGGAAGQAGRVGGGVAGRTVAAGAGAQHHQQSGGLAGPPYQGDQWEEAIPSKPGKRDYFEIRKTFIIHVFAERERFQQWKTTKKPWKSFRFYWVVWLLVCNDYQY